MKYFIFSDVHGYYSMLKEELLKYGYDENNEEHMLISLGDNFDRGPENFKMYEFLKEMKEKKKIILVKGNHEDLFLDMLYKGYATHIDERNGTYKTLIEFISKYFDGDSYDMFYYNAKDVYYKLRDEGILDFFYDMKDYYETKKYIFTHAFIPIDENEFKYKKDWRDSTKDEFKSSRWKNGIQMSIDFGFNEPGKKIVIGHYHTSYGHVRKDFPNKSVFAQRDLEFSNDANFGIYEDDFIIAIDACTNFSIKMNILVVEDEELC